MKPSNRNVVNNASSVSRLTSFRNIKKKNRKTYDIKVGRPNSFDKEKLKELIKVYYTYPYSYRKLADMFGVSRMTVWRAIQDAQTLAIPI